MIISYYPNGLVALVGAADPNLESAEVDDDPRLHEGYTIYYQDGELNFEKSYQMLQEELTQ